MVCKRIDELTYDEVLDMTEDDINKQVALEMAYEGIPEVTPPLQPKLLSKPMPDTEVYSLPDFHTCDKKFLQEILDIINAHTDKLCSFTYGKGYTKVLSRWETRDRALDIRVEKTFSSVPDSDEAGRIEKINEKNANEYKDELEKYTIANDGINNIRDNVLLRCRNVEWVKNKINELHNNWRKFIFLAKNDEEVAKVFFDKTYGKDYEKLLDAAMKQGLTVDQVSEQVFRHPPLPLDNEFHGNMVLQG